MSCFWETCLNGRVNVFLPLPEILVFLMCFDNVTGLLLFMESNHLTVSVSCWLHFYNSVNEDEFLFGIHLMLKIIVCFIGYFSYFLIAKLGLLYAC